MCVQPKTTGTASAGKTLLPTRSPAEAVSFCGHLFCRRYFPARYNFLAVLQIKRIYEAPQPSDGHHPKHWPEFQKRYRQELRDKSELAARIKQLENEHDVVTLVFSVRDEERNQAVVLRDFLAKRPRRSERRRADKSERRRAYEKACG